MPWSDIPPEGEILKAVDGTRNKQFRILLSEMAVNTAEEVEVVALLMGAHNIKRVVLVTSSFHMPRAKFCLTIRK